MREEVNDIAQFNRILRRELHGMGVDLGDDKTWEVMQRISNAAVDYASKLREEFVSTRS